MLKFLWNQDFSAREIGAKLKRVRNSIIGKAHRLGLPTRERKKGVTVIKEPGPRKKKKPVMLYKPRPEPDASLAPALEGPVGGVALTDLRHYHCRAIIDLSDLSDASVRYCGGKIERGSYCAHHGALYYVTPRR